MWIFGMFGICSGTEYQIPYHIVLEYAPGENVATVVTAYIPDRDLWVADWKTRKRTKGKKKKR